MSQTHSASSIILKVLRLAIGVGLIVYLIQQLDLSEWQRAVPQRTDTLSFFFIGLLAALTAVSLSAIRWNYLLNALGYRQRTTRTIQITFIGQFFNNFLLGACGGDIVRAYYITKEAPRGSRAEALTTVLLDRSLGLFAIVLWCIPVVYLAYSRLFSTTLTATATWIIIAVIVAIPSAYLLYKLRKQLIAIAPALRYAFEHPLSLRVITTLQEFKKSPRLVLLGIIYSLFQNGLLGLSCLCFGRSLQLAVPPIDYFIYYPIITLLSSIPITPGALGVRETLFVKFFALSSLSAGLAILLSLLVYVGGLVSGLAGGIVFMAYNSNKDFNWKTLLADIRASAKSE